MTWLGHPVEASPLVCARFGWKNAAFQVLRCDACEVEFPFSSRRERGATKEQDFEKVLTEKHHKDCIWRRQQDPKSFCQIQLKPLESASKDFLQRFDGFNLLWDLPEMEAVTDGTVEDDMNLMSKFLIERQSRSLEKSESDKLEAGLRKRVQDQMMLSLLGWKLKWTPRFVYLGDENGSEASFSEGQSNQPKESGICFGRQAYVTCDLCSAKKGLWSCRTHADLQMAQFQSMTKKQQPSADEPPLLGLKRKREVEIKEKKEALLDATIFSTPAFGLRKLRKTTKEEMPRFRQFDEEQGADLDKDKDVTQNKFRDYYPVASEKQFHPSDDHRYFCPYRSDWNQLLKALAGS